MRPRSLVVPAVVAVLASVAIPSPAFAASQCSLVLPTKVVVDSRTESIPYRLSSNCASSGASAASWDLLHADGSGWAMDFGPADFAEGTTDGTLALPDTGTKGVYRGHPLGAEQADGDPLTQNTPLMTVKAAARLSLAVAKGNRFGFTRHTFTVKATVWSGSTHAWVPRTSGQAELLELRNGVWARAGMAYLDSDGEVVLWPDGVKPGDKFRVRILETASVWASGSSVVTIPS